MDDPRLADLRAEAAAVRQCLRQPPGPVHMLGIGGVGMAGLAVHLAARGHRVTGCDAACNSVTTWLAGQGMEVAQGHDPGHLSGREQFVVRSPAVHDEQPELRRVKELAVPLFARGTVLPVLLEGVTSIAVGGAHGKTTTSAMIAHALRGMGVDASFCIGGEVPTLGGVAGTGRAGTLVVEADESDGTLALYEADYAVVTNVELDHVDFFHSEAELHACFRFFAAQAKRALVFCADDAGAAAAAVHARHRRSYGFGPDAWLRGTDVREEGRRAGCDVSCQGLRLGRLELQVPGRTNLLNGLAAVAVALDLGHSFTAVADALRDFRSVRRRFDVLAEAGGITVISDYAHHPTEIRALLQQVQGLGARRVLAVFQPHRYSRTAALGPDFPPAFAGVAEVVLVPVYAASEAPVPGGAIEDLHAQFARHGHVPARLTHSLLEAWDYIRNKWRAGDVVLVVGAGDVEVLASWAHQELLSLDQT